VRRDAGLTSSEAARRLAAYGPNEVPAGRGRSLARRVLAQLRDPLVLTLLAAAVLTTAVGDLSDTAVILLVVSANTAIGVSQEVRADHAVAALTRVAAPTARVERDGRQRVLPAREVVPGDVVLLEAGDVVPADARLLEAPALQVDESALTGESVPVDKQGGVPQPEDVRPGPGDGTGDDAPDGPAGLHDPGAVLAGTVVTRGRGRAVATATGRASALGHVAALLGTDGPGLTPLQRRLASLGTLLAGGAVVLSALVLVLGLARGQDPALMVVTAVSLVVAAVPESLPAVATLSLALGAHRMAARRAIVRRLPAVETLGSVTVLATDKTGTLTEGRMVAERAWTPVHEAVATGHGYAPGGAVRVLPSEGTTTDGAAPTGPGPLPEDLRSLALAAALCTDARLVPPAGEGDDWEAAGDPTEAALLAFAARAGLDPDRARDAYPRVAELPFDSVRTRMTTVHADGDGYLVACKGAPDVLLAPPLLADPPALLAAARHRAEAYAADGYRVLAVATGRCAAPPARLADAEQGLRLAGLVALDDPPRAEARAAVDACRGAGIVPVLVTGDHPATARAVASRVGVTTERGAVVSGADLDGTHVPDPADAAVFARTTPAQKLDLVTAWRESGHVVAMTGDGVNDGPALRHADIGVAMGGRGTEVAKQAADLVLADDDLSTVVEAVEEGRRVYANVRRFLRYGLSGGAAEILVMLVGPLLGMPVPLLPAQILWINLMTHGVPGVALGAEPGEAGAMDRHPRPPEQTVLGGGLWQQVLALGTLLAVVSLAVGVWAHETGGPWRTTVFLTLGLLQLGVALGLRTRRPDHGQRNPFLLVAVAVAALLQLGVVYWGPAQALLGTQDLAAAELAVVLPASLVGFVAVRLLRAGGERRAARRRRTGVAAP
jgi:P-type Ca2+ transporter type 2C